MSKSFGGPCPEKSAPCRPAILALILLVAVLSIAMQGPIGQFAESWDGDRIDGHQAGDATRLPEPAAASGGVENRVRLGSVGALTALGIPLALAVIGFALGVGVKGRRSQRIQPGARSDSGHSATGPVDAIDSLEHELRTGLSAAVSLTELLLDTRLEKEQKQYAVALTDALRSACYLVDSRLSSTYSTDVFANDDSVVFSLCDVVRNVQLLFAAGARRRKVEIVIDVADDIPAAIYGDGNKVRQILVNLVSNALKHSNSRSIEIGCNRDTAQRKGHDGSIRIVVRDVGRGIPAADQERLFQSVRCIRGATQGRSESSGLGLAICRDLAYSMGGEIGVDSRVGDGSCFWFTFPARSAGRHIKAGRPALTAGSRVVDVATDGKSKTQSADACRVLVVEDHQVIAMVTRRILESDGHEVTVVNDARAAVEICDRETFSIILMDHRLPYGCGLEAARGIRERERLRGTRSLLVLVTAVEIDERFRAAAYAAGVDDILRKPIPSAVLKSLVRSGSPPDGVGTRSVEEIAITNPNLISDLVRVDGGNGQSLLEVLLEKTATGMAGWCSEIESAAQSGDTHSVNKLSHRLLGICMQLGAPRMATLCERLAGSGSEGAGKLSRVPMLTEALGQEFRKFQAEIQIKAHRHLELSKFAKTNRMEDFF